MSTDDKIPVCDKPCVCGKGKFLITKYVPDHEYASESQAHWVSEITCPECENNFALIEQGKAVCLVRAADLVAEAEAKAVSQIKCKEVEALAETTGCYDALTHCLLSPRYAAASLRKLGNLAITTHREQEFRRAFREKPNTAPMKAWVKKYAECWQLSEFIKCLEQPFPQIEKQIEAWREHRVPPVPVIEKLCRTN